MLWGLAWALLLVVSVRSAPESSTISISARLLVLCGVLVVVPVVLTIAWSISEIPRCSRGLRATSGGLAAIGAVVLGEYFYANALSITVGNGFRPLTSLILTITHWFDSTVFVVLWRLICVLTVVGGSAYYSRGERAGLKV